MIIPVFFLSYFGIAWRRILSISKKKEREEEKKK
jgi:hypothetical protein